jgi:hypothetical protein
MIVGSPELFQRDLVEAQSCCPWAELQRFPFGNPPTSAMATASSKTSPVLR